MYQKQLSARAIIALAVVAAGMISICGLPSFAGNGSITIVKDAIPDALVYFKYTGDLGTFYLDDDGVGANYKTFTCLLPRQYTITEVLPSDWGLFDITISDPDEGSTQQNSTAIIDLDPDESVVVTFTNTKQGRIIVDKVTVPAGDPQLFTFNPSWDTSFQLADATTPYDSGWLNPGTYSVTEIVPTGWTLTSVVCSDGSDPSAIDLSAGETVKVTFTNMRQAPRGTITVVKDAVPSSSQEFSFTGDLGSFSLIDNGIEGNSREFTGLAPGIYNVEEVLPGGWELTSIVPDDPDGGSTADLGDATVSIDLDAGENIIVTFADTELLDFGDAPAPYPTLLANNGARHELPATGHIWMGSQVDGETDGQPTDLDGADEDGVVLLGSGPVHGPFTMPFVPGQYGAVRITISGGEGYLHGWFDWNADGDWSDPGENVLSLGPLAPKAYNIVFSVPSSARSGTSWARFRLDDQNLDSFVGLAHNGEVEDYMVEVGVAPMPPPNPPQPSEPAGTSAPTLTWWGMIILPFLMALALLLRCSTRGSIVCKRRKPYETPRRKG